MKFQKSKCKVLGPGQNNCTQLDRLGTERDLQKRAVHSGQEVDHELALCLAVK